MIRYVSAMAAGALFAAGLVVSGLAHPGRIMGFLDVGGAWDPFLLFSMVAGVLTHAATRRLLARDRAVLGAVLPAPNRGPVDLRLAGGAVIFGVGWGLAGVCPGPALVTLGTGTTASVVFFGCLCAGIVAGEALTRQRAR